MVLVVCSAGAKSSSMVSIAADFTGGCDGAGFKVVGELFVGCGALTEPRGIVFWPYLTILVSVTGTLIKTKSKYVIHVGNRTLTSVSL
jgi:hypothetical protein